MELLGDHSVQYGCAFVASDGGIIWSAGNANPTVKRINPQTGFEK